MGNRPPIAVPLSAARRPFPVTCYIDESGQFMPERPEQTAGGVWIARRELGVLVAVLRPGLEPLDDAVVSLVHTLRGRYGRPSGRLKTADMPVDARLEVARLIQRRDWQVYQQAVELSPDLDQGVAEHLIQHVRAASKTLGPERAAEASVDALLDQIGRMDRTQVAWGMSLYQLLTLICADGRQAGNIPIGRFVLDEKLPRGWPELAGFLVRWGIMMQHPQVFNKSLGFAFGLDQAEETFDVVVSTDDDEPGLVLADVCASVLGRGARLGRDAGADVDAFMGILQQRLYGRGGG